VGFPGFSDIGVNSGTAVMARRTGRRDRGMPGIPGEVADSGAGAARGERRWLERDSRHARREGKDNRGFKEIIELSGKVLKTLVI
jgi:hypothetical protein